MKPWPLLVVLMACGSQPRTAPMGTVVVGHGGTGPDGAFPMNTTRAVEAALKAGATGVELDVQLSADGILVCFHDEHLDDLTTCTGLVHAHPWIPTLERCTYRDVEGQLGLMALETVTHSMDSTATLVLDCKLFAAGSDWPGYLDEFVTSLNDHAARFEGPRELVIECQVTEFLDRFTADTARFNTFYYTKDFTGGLATAMEKGYDGITIEADLITPAQVARAQAAGLRVAVFGIDRAEEAAHLGADILEVDRP